MSSPYDYLDAFGSDADDPGVVRAKALRDAADQLLADRVHHARLAGVPWTTIGKQLGLARQTVALRYGNPPKATTM